jgi:hypothetical protein
MTTYQPATIPSSLFNPYEQDYCVWLGQTIEYLQAKEFTAIDLEYLIEELKDMGRSQKDALESNLQIVLMHLLKYQYQPEKRSNSWRYTILEHRDRLERAFKHSPSLSPYLQSVFDECYRKARRKASVETGMDIHIFPIASPYSVEQVLDLDYLPA